MKLVGERGFEPPTPWSELRVVQFQVLDLAPLRDQTLRLSHFELYRTLVPSSLADQRPSLSPIHEAGLSKPTSSTCPLRPSFTGSEPWSHRPSPEGRKSSMVGHGKRAILIEHRRICEQSLGGGFHARSAVHAAEDVQTGTQPNDGPAECGATFAAVEPSEWRAVGDEDVKRGRRGSKSRVRHARLRQASQRRHRPGSPANPRCVPPQWSRPR
jgi:hypothetical protein